MPFRRDVYILAYCVPVGLKARPGLVGNGHSSNDCVLVYGSGHHIMLVWINNINVVPSTREKIKEKRKKKTRVDKIL